MDFRFIPCFTITLFFPISLQKKYVFSLTFGYRNSVFRDKLSDGLRSTFKKYDICQVGTYSSLRSGKA